jgi:hypothetical protein
MRKAGGHRQRRMIRMTRRRASNTRKPVKPIAYQSVTVRILTSSSIDAVILLIHEGRGGSQDIGCHAYAYKCLDRPFQPLHDAVAWK